MMTEIPEPKGELTPRKQKRRPALTRDALFRVWRAAIKDNHDKVADDMIQKVYDDMMAFDRDRAEGVMDLIVRRHAAAKNAFIALLRDMRAISARSPKWLRSIVIQQGRALLMRGLLASPKISA
jgi:hypothetical protein